MFNMLGGRGVKLIAALATIFTIHFSARSQKDSTIGTITNQSTQLRYDVVSIKPNKSGGGGAYFSERSNGYFAENAAVVSFLMYAYNTLDTRIVGLPGWASTDLEAKILSDNIYDNLTQEQKSNMMIEVLSSRFGIKAHFELREGSVYKLVVDKKGSKMKGVSDTDIKSEVYVRNRGNIQGTALSMSTLADELSTELGKDVIDDTQLKGMYQVDLQWDPNEASVANENVADTSKPSIYAALPEQLGVRLVPARSEVRFLIIDHINGLVPN
jgi:uncharacterized protein (TIGR03435 family)